MVGSVWRLAAIRQFWLDYRQRGADGAAYRSFTGYQSFGNGQRHGSLAAGIYFCGHTLWNVA